MKVLALIFDGFEELEATAPFALIRRVGIPLTIASTRTDVVGTHHLHYVDITPLEKVDYEDYDALVLPGGPHYLFLEKSEDVLEIIHHFFKKQKIVAAICAAPTVLGRLGYLAHRNYTCFTSMDEDFGGCYLDQNVVVDDNLITARSAAASMEFAFKIIEKVAGIETLEAVQKRIYYEK